VGSPRPGEAGPAAGDFEEPRGRDNEWAEATRSAGVEAGPVEEGHVTTRGDLRPWTALLLFLLAAPAAAAPPKGAEPAKGSAPAKAGAAPAPAGPPAPRLGPLPASEKAAWTHAPYAAGECSVCHERNDPKSPGKLSRPGNDLCFMCHDEFQAIMARPHRHAPAASACTACHNAHDAKQRKLLHAEMGALCAGCHPKVKDAAERSRVKHNALTEGQKCLNCHNPHATNVEKLLTMLPFDLCVSCHGVDGLKDDGGRALTNFQKLLADNKEHHAPVAAKDCSACHLPHGGDHFRLLVADYPPEFYAPYDPKNYELCFTCHNADAVKAAETDTLTGFRDGKRNLHYVHVNKLDRGRTCRACHEVHASKQAHHIRDGVPYGSKGWMLKINFTQTPGGGSCARTCHDTKGYDRKAAPDRAAKK
jgi:predicted CXXCH cytochrome family protein